MNSNDHAPRSRASREARILTLARQHGLAAQTEVWGIAIGCPICADGQQVALKWQDYEHRAHCKGCGRGAFEIMEALRSASPAPRGEGDRFPGLTHAEALRQKPEPERQLVRGLVGRGSVGALASLPELGKSRLALEIAFKITVGGRVLDRDVLHTGPTAYWWQDDSTDEELARMQAYAFRHDHTGELPITWHFNEGLQLPADLEALRAEIEAKQQVFVVLDSLYNFLPDGTGLKDEVVGDVLKRLKAEVCDPTGCTIMIVDHAPWPTEANQGRSRAYGTVFKTAAIRWGIYLTEKNGVLRLEARGNNMPCTKPTPILWINDEMQYRFVDQPERAVKASAGEIAAWIRERPTMQAKPGEIMQRFDISDGTLRNRRGDLQKLGVEYMSAGTDSVYTADQKPPLVPRNVPIPPRYDPADEEAAQPRNTPIGVAGCQPPRNTPTTPTTEDDLLANLTARLHAGEDYDELEAIYRSSKSPE